MALAYKDWPPERKAAHIKTVMAWRTRNGWIKKHEAERAAQRRRDDPEKEKAARKRHYESWGPDKKAKEAARLREYNAGQRRNPATWVKGALRAARHRAKAKGVPFTVTAADIEIPLVCPVLGLTLQFGATMRDPATPNLDRMKPHLGYVKGNVRVISWRANSLKKDASLDELKALVRYMEGT